MKKYISLLLALLILAGCTAMTACNKTEEDDTPIEVASAYTEQGQLSTTAAVTTAAPTTAAPTEPPTEAPKKDYDMIDYIGMTVSQVMAIHGNKITVPSSLIGGGIQPFYFDDVCLTFGYKSDARYMGEYPSGGEVINYVYCDGSYKNVSVHPGAKVGSNSAELNLNMALVFENMVDGGYGYNYSYGSATVMYRWSDAAATIVESVTVCN